MEDKIEFIIAYKKDIDNITCLYQDIETKELFNVNWKRICFWRFDDECPQAQWELNEEIPVESNNNALIKKLLERLKKSDIEFKIQFGSPECLDLTHYYVNNTFY